VPDAGRWERQSVMSKNLITVKHQAPFQVFDLFLEEHDAICDLMEEVLGHTELSTLEDLLVRTHENTMGLYDENDLDEVRSHIPESKVKVATLTEDEMLSLAWEIIQAVKEMRAQSIERLKVIK
jgi:hypothetical protein